MTRALVLAALLTACATPTPREPFSLTALLLDAPGYVASRYDRNELPAALIADLTQQGFQCQHSATMSECLDARRAFGSCTDVILVRIGAEVVSAESDRRCLGALP